MKRIFLIYFASVVLKLIAVYFKNNGSPDGLINAKNAIYLELFSSAVSFYALIELIRWAFQRKDTKIGGVLLILGSVGIITGTYMKLFFFNNEVSSILLITGGIAELAGFAIVAKGFFKRIKLSSDQKV